VDRVSKDSRNTMASASSFETPAFAKASAGSSGWGRNQHRVGGHLETLR